LLLKRVDQQYQYFRLGFEREAVSDDIDVQVKRLQIITSALQEYARGKGLELALETDSVGVLQPVIR
jgi:hypothetical protein